MKKFTTSLMLLLPFTMTFAQNSAPVAVNDTIWGPVTTGDIITVNVINNDYDPDGDAIKIKEILPNTFVISNTDSTITFKVGQIAGDSIFWNFKYRIEDEFNYSNINISTARVVFYYVSFSAGYLDINNIDARFNAFGNHFWDLDGLNHYYFPKGEPTQTMFTFTFWLGGMDLANNLHLAGERYRQVGEDYWTGPLSFNNDSTWISESTSNDYFKIWKLNKDEVAYHILHYNDPGYVPIDNILNWPAQGDTTIGQAAYLAPFVDMNNNGIYEPMEGDYPLIRGDQTLFFIFNDQKIHTETQGLQLGIEIHGFAYAFNAPEDPYLNNTTFLSYKIFNRSSNTYTDTYAGLFSDIDLGYAWDDFIGCDVARGAYYCYNGDSIDGDGEPETYGDHPPAQGIVVLGGPYMDPDGIDNPAGGCDESINGVGFGDGEVDNERFGMNHFIYFNNTGNIQGDPQEDMDYYNYMKNIWLDGSAMLYGGNGLQSSGAYGPEANFMYPGLSDPCNWGTGGAPPNGPVEWTEVTAGNSPSDRRGMCSMGPFTLEPGGFEKIDIAFVTALGDDYMQSVDKLMSAIDSVRTFYNSDPDHFGYTYLGTNDRLMENARLTIYPNPAGSSISFDFMPESTQAQFRIIDSFGRIVKEGQLSKSGKQHINIQNFEQGLYILQIAGENLIKTQKFLKK